MAKRTGRPKPVTEAGTADTSLRLIPSLYRDAQHYAVDDRRSVSSVINESIRDFLKVKGVLSDRARKDFDEYLRRRG